MTDVSLLFAFRALTLRRALSVEDLLCFLVFPFFFQNNDRCGEEILEAALLPFWTLPCRVRLDPGMSSNPFAQIFLDLFFPFQL